jgi:hypothetical protein
LEADIQKMQDILVELLVLPYMLVGTNWVDLL